MSATTRAWLAVASLCASALLSFSTSSLAQTELPKEGPVAATGIFHSNLKSVGVGDLVQFSYEAKGGWVADKPGGFGDRLTVRCVGSGRTLKGKIKFEYNMCEYTDPAGDKFYSKLENVSSDADKVVNKTTLISGTGKYSGITGGWEVVRRSHRPPGEGEGMSSTKITGTYKLP
jgi:hypothetical protein